jgi:hypothetical protein
MKPLRLVKAEAEAVDRLVDLIKEHNKWVEPEAQGQSALQTVP